MTSENVSTLSVERRIKLIPKVTAALADTAELLGLSEPDVVNRAVQLYAFVEAQRHRYGDTMALIRADGTVERVDFDEE